MRLGNSSRSAPRERVPGGDAEGDTLEKQVDVALSRNVMCSDDDDQSANSSESHHNPEHPRFVTGVEGTGNPRRSGKRGSKSGIRLSSHISVVPTEGVSNGGTLAPEDETGEVSSAGYAAIAEYLTAAVGGDDITRLAVAHNTVMLDYPEPGNVQEALSTPDAEEWSRAMEEEFGSMKRCDLLSDPVPLPPNGRVVGTKWVFKRKRNIEGKVERFRARLVAKGFMQIFGLDYFGTYAPVARLATLRLVYALAVLLKLELASLDVEAAFMNAELKEELYIRAPPGTTPLPDGYVYRLRKSLYGLKQSPKEWNTMLTAFMVKDCGFAQLRSETCLFINRNGGLLLLVAIYVDDIIIAYNCAPMFNSFRAKLQARFKCKDLGTLTRALNMEVLRTQNGDVFLSQASYVRDVLDRFKDHLPLTANPSELPADPKTRLYAGGAKVVKSYMHDTTGERDEEEATKDCEAKVPYRELLGALLWVSQGTRPDITYAVAQCAKFSHKPKNAHWWALKKILRYLKGTVDYGIIYRRPGDRKVPTLQELSLPEAYLSSVSAKEAAGIVIDGNVDADYANSIDDRRSVSGYVNFMAEGPISWQSKTQASVALSTMESEYMALAAEVQEAIYLRMVLQELGVELSGPVVIREDNKACQMFSEHAGNFARTKHIDVRYHFVRERRERGDVRVDYVCTSEQVADIFTKALPRDQFKKFRERLVLPRSSVQF